MNYDKLNPIVKSTTKIPKDWRFYVNYRGFQIIALVL